MNLTGRPIYQKQGKPEKKPSRVRPVSKKKAKARASKEGQKALAYMAAVKQLPCVICGAAAPSDAHHVFHDRYGTSKASDFETIPLCKSHHQDGPDAIHNGKESWREKYGPDHGYIEKVRKRIDPALWPKV